MNQLKTWNARVLRILSAALPMSLVVSALALSVTLLPVAAQPLDRSLRPVKPDAQGKRLYIVNLRPEMVLRERAEGEPPARSPMDPANKTDVLGWHEPKARAMVKGFERQFGVQVTSMTSYALPSFAAYMSEETVGRIRRDPRVAKVRLSYEAADFSQAPPWDDVIGAETIPWGKTAIGTNDTWSAPAANIVYMIDSGMPPANNDLVNIVETPVNDGVIISTAHSSHVAGILSAAINGAQVRGVNPGAVILNVNRGITDVQVRAALDWALGDAESRGIYGVANISSNSERWAENDDSDIALFMRRLANRVLVVQSAGNGNRNTNLTESACNVSHGPARPNDGILVVSGVDRQGRQAVPFDNRHVGPEWIVDPGANWGPCVELWAPAQDIWSTWDTGANAVQRLSGTSMAAPYVAGLAARFGSTVTTPVERESHIRARLRATGALDQTGAAIVVPSYLQPSAFMVPTRLWNLTATADATAPGASTAYVSDGIYLSLNVWSAGHAPPAWIEFDLIYPRTLASIRLTPQQDPPEGSVTHQIYVGNAPNPTTLAATITQNSLNMAVLVAGLNNVVGRYVRVLTTATPQSDEVEFREIELYAAQRTDEATIDWFYLALLGRPADPGGYAFWLGQLRTARCSDPNSVHGTLNWINSAFMYSGEFQARGLSNQAYVNALYEGVLRRDADPGGLAYWTGQLDSGARTREDVRLNFVFSAEFVNNTVAPIMNESCAPI